MTSQPNSQPNNYPPESAQPGAGPTNDQDMVIIRERKKQRRKHRTKKKQRLPRAAKVLLIVLAALLLIAVGIWVFLTYNIQKGNEELHAPAARVAQSSDTIKRNGHEYAFNKNVVSILMLGKDDEGTYGIDRSCTDANVLVTLDTETKKLDVVAIPRDSMVEVDLYKDGEYTHTALHQLAVAYGVQVDGDDAAAHNTMKSVTRLFYNMPVEHYFVLEMDAIGELASAVGGVQVEAIDTYPGADFEVGDTVLLEGDAALSYVRYRDINVDLSAQHRQQRQMQFVKAFVEKLRTLSAGEIVDLYNTIQASSYTNLKLSDISYLASVFVNGKKSTTNYPELEGETKLELDDDGVEREHVYLDEDSVMDVTLDAYYTQVE